MAAAAGAAQGVGDDQRLRRRRRPGSPPIRCPQATCYQYFKEALIVWTFAQAQKWFLEFGVRMNCVAPGPVFTPILGDFVTMLGEERVQNERPA